MDELTGNLMMRKSPIIGEENAMESTTCPKCFRVFSKRSTMMGHLKFIHSKQRAPVTTCPFCPTTFMYKKNLSRHIRKKHPSNV
ncbi:Uncharacterised protein g4109 [Pycnogonum litorale]